MGACGREGGDGGGWWQSFNTMNMSSLQDSFCWGGWIIPGTASQAITRSPVGTDEVGCVWLLVLAGSPRMVTFC